MSSSNLGFAALLFILLYEGIITNTQFFLLLALITTSSCLCGNQADNSTSTV